MTDKISRTNQAPFVLSPAEWILVTLVFVVCFVGAALVPMEQCPDEWGRAQLTNWMVSTGTLPTGNEAETILSNWGFSYALRPFLPQMIGALFVRITGLVTTSPRLLLLAARMPSVLSVTACCLFALGLGHRLFKRRESSVLFASLVSLLPQVVFLGMYQNNDAPSLATVAGMLYFMVRGYDDEWRCADCVGLGICASMCLLTYYNAYGWILSTAVFCVVAVLRDAQTPDRKRLLVRRVVLVVGICAALAGWFFVRNALLHEGDALGFAEELRSRARLEAQGIQLVAYVVPRNEGMSFFEFFAWKNWEVFWMSTRSFVGTFGYMLIYIPLPRYGLYYALFLCGVVVYALVVMLEHPSRRDSLLVLMMLVASAITVFLHLWASYSRDYEPQGRYVITLIFLLGYMMCYGMDNTNLLVKGRGNKGDVPLPVAQLLGIAWITLFALTYFGTMTQMLA